MNRITTGWISTLSGILIALGAPIAAAQNTGGVFPPGVDEGHRSAQYRITYDPDSHAQAQRLHYQQSVNGEVMWRIVGQARKTAESDFDPDFLQGEIFWELNTQSPTWGTGFRLDLRYRDEGRPGQIGLNWMNQFKLSDTAIARALLLTSTEVGDGRRGGLFWQTRFMVQNSLGTRNAVGVELYNSYGEIDDTSVSDNQQQLGPYLNTALGNGYSSHLGVRFGLTDATPDTNLRFWLTKSF